MAGKPGQSISFLPVPVLQGLGLLIFARLVVMLTLPIEGLKGYGDIYHFFQLAALKGLPYITYWSEFPPIFPFLSEAIYFLSGGIEHVYLYLVVLFLLVVDCFNLLLFYELVSDLQSTDWKWQRAVFYLVLLISLPYGWWYFDSLAVFTFLAALWLILRKKRFLAGLAIGIGILVKFFPVIVLASAWIQFGFRRSLRVFVPAVCLPLLVYGLLWTASPDYTRASLLSQFSKGSWETVWALLDGNRGTGNFGAWEERYDPQTAAVLRGNPAVIPPLLVFALAGGLGLGVILTIQNRSPFKAVSVSLWGLCLIFLASPGWSVQWVVYLLPLIIILVPLRMGALFSGVLVLVNVLEWPVLLSRGYFDLLPVTILIRSAIFILLVFSSVPLVRSSTLTEHAGHEAI